MSSRIAIAAAILMSIIIPNLLSIPEEKVQYSSVLLGFPIGTDEKYFSDVASIAVDSKDNVYVAVGSSTDGTDYTQKFDSNGVFVTSWGSRVKDAAEGQFSQPTDIAVDSRGYVYYSSNSPIVEVCAPRE